MGGERGQSQCQDVVAFICNELVGPGPGVSIRAGCTNACPHSACVIGVCVSAYAWLP